MSIECSKWLEEGGKANKWPVCVYVYFQVLEKSICGKKKEKKKNERKRKDFIQSPIEIVCKHQSVRQKQKEWDFSLLFFVHWINERFSSTGMHSRQVVDFEMLFNKLILTIERRVKEYQISFDRSLVLIDFLLFFHLQHAFRDWFRVFSSVFYTWLRKSNQTITWMLLLIGNRIDL